MLKLFKKKERTNHKLTLSELVWFGFNYTVGITFTANFAILINKDSLNLGSHMIWIFLVEGLIAGTCAWAFSRLSRVHPGNNGAAYIYVRSSYGRFWGWLISFLQYATLPVIVSSQIVSMIRINFTDPSSFLYANWGVWQHLGLDLIGILIYGLASCVLFLGMAAFKKFVNISSYLKWGTTFLLIIATIILFVMAGTSNWDMTTSHQQLTANNFSQAFAMCFFFFLGFETYSTIGKNVRNPEKNISHSLVIVMILSTIFYMAVTILMIGAVAGNFSDNPNLSIFKILGDKAHAQWLGIIGILVMLICTISLKSNAGMQNALYSGAILEPLSVEGYISPKYKELSKDNIPFKASRLNLVITFSSAFVWLILPDIIGVIVDTLHPVYKDGQLVLSSIVNYGTLTAEAGIIMVIIYVFVLSIAIKLSIEKKLKKNIFEIIIWIAATLFLVWQFEEWLRSLINGLISGASLIGKGGTDITKGISDITSNVLQLIYLIASIAFALIWYFAYYKPMQRKRMLTNPKLQEELDSEFRVKDDWPFVAKNLQNEIENYLVRNVLINGDDKNPNYTIAKNVRKELLMSEGEWREDEE